MEESSGLNHYDEKGNVITSPTGPRGAFQFTKATAGGYNVKRDNPIDNIVGAAQYMVDNYKAVRPLLDDEDEAWIASAIAHNRGLGAVQSMIRNRRFDPGGKDSGNGGDTRSYATRIINNWAKLRGSAPKNPLQPVAFNTGNVTVPEVKMTGGETLPLEMASRERADQIVGGLRPTPENMQKLGLLPSDPQPIGSADVRELQGIGEAARQGQMYQQPVPEAQQTLAAQRIAANDPAGTRAAVLYGVSDEMPAVSVNETDIALPDGRVLRANKEKLTAYLRSNKILRSQIESGKADFTPLIGGKADPSAVTSGKPAVITTAPDGTELVASTVDSPASIMHEPGMQKAQFPNQPTKTAVTDADTIGRYRQWLSQYEGVTDTPEMRAAYNDELKGKAEQDYQKRLDEYEKKIEQFNATVASQPKAGGQASPIANAVEIPREYRQVNRNLTSDEFRDSVAGTFEIDLRGVKGDKTLAASRAAMHRIAAKYGITFDQIEAYEQSRKGKPIFAKGATVKPDAEIATVDIAMSAIEDILGLDAAKSRYFENEQGLNIDALTTAGAGELPPVAGVSDRRPEDVNAEARAELVDEGMKAGKNPDGTLSLTDTNNWTLALEQWMDDPLKAMGALKWGAVFTKAPTDEDRRRIVEDSVDELIASAGSAQRVRQLRNEYEKMDVLEKGIRHSNDFVQTILRSPAAFAKTIAWAEDTKDYLEEKAGGVQLGIDSADVLNSVDWVWSKMFGLEHKTAKPGEVPMLIARSIENAFPDDPKTAHTFTGKISRGLGSAVSFMLGAVASGGSSTVTALMGIGMQAGEMYDQAKQADLSREKQLLAGLMGVPIGASEVLGLKWAKLGELINGKTNGLFVRSFLQWTKNTGKEFTEEALQEYCQSVSGQLTIDALKKNGLTRADVAKALGGSFDDAAIGGLVGLIFGGGVPLAAKAAETAANKLGVESVDEGSPILPQSETGQEVAEPVKTEAVTENEPEISQPSAPMDAGNDVPAAKVPTVQEELKKPVESKPVKDKSTDRVADIATDKTPASEAPATDTADISADKKPTVQGIFGGESATEPAFEAAPSPTNDRPEPTEAQKEAGNYKKGHISVNGLDISVENPVGSDRKGVDRDGKKWSVRMKHHYGYIKRTIGADKENIDLFIKDGTPADFASDVYIVDQVHPDTGKFDEHKVMLGFGSEQEAREAYSSNYAKDWKGLKSITAMPFDQFKQWATSEEQMKPAAKTRSKKPKRDATAFTLYKGDRVRHMASDNSSIPDMLKEGWSTEKTPEVIAAEEEFERELAGASEREKASGVLYAKDEPSEVTQDVHKFSSTQVNLPAAQTKQVLDLGQQLIADEDVYIDPADPSYGREENPHITVKWGLHTSDANDVRKILSAEKPFKVKLGKISTFPAGEDREYDVVKIDVDSPELHRINKLIGDGTEVTTTFPDYKPHVTLAYVNKGKGAKYAGRDDLAGTEIEFKSIAFSGKDGNEVESQLAVKATSKKSDVPNIKGLREGLADGSIEDVTGKNEVLQSGPKRSWRAGSNQAEIVFTSELQRDLYDFAANEDYKMRGGQNKAGDRTVKSYDKTALAKRAGVSEDDLYAHAKAVLTDVKAQMKGVQDGETRSIREDTKEAAQTVADIPTLSTSEQVDPDADPTAKEARESVKKEKVSERTGLTKTQTEFLAQGLQDAVYDAILKGTGFETIEEFKVQWKNEADAETLKAVNLVMDEFIKVPGDGNFKVNSIPAANRLHQKITGHPIPGFGKAKGATIPRNNWDEYVASTRKPNVGKPSKLVQDQIAAEQEFFQDLLKLNPKARGTQYSDAASFEDYPEGAETVRGWKKEAAEASTEKLKELLAKPNPTRTKTAIIQLELQKRGVNDSIGKEPVKKVEAEEVSPEKDAAEPATVIEDFGEKIGGARKDMWAGRGLTIEDLAGMSAREKTRLVRKDQVWPKPDYQEITDHFEAAGVEDPHAHAYAVKLLYDGIAQPRMNFTDAAWTMYVESVGEVRAVIAKQIETPTADWYKDLVPKIFGDDIFYRSGRYINPKSEAYPKMEILGSTRFANSFPQSEMSIRRAKSKAEAINFPSKREAWMNKYAVFPGDKLTVVAGQTYLDGKFVPVFRVEVYSKGVGNVKLAEYPSMKDAVEFKGGLKGQAVLAASSSKEEGFDGKRFKVFETEEKATDVAKTLYKKRNDKQEGEPVRPMLKGIKRSGTDYRKGEHATSEMFQEAFGFRGVEFGNWLNAADRQQSLDHAYDALRDLADALNVHPRALSLNGHLGLAFGARGSGGKNAGLAHYEPSKIVINLTKMSGAGSLAHEWGHSVDDYFGSLASSVNYRTDPHKGYSSEMSGRGGLRPEMQDAWRKVVSAILERVATEEETVEEASKEVAKQKKVWDSWMRHIFHGNPDLTAVAITAPEPWIEKGIVLQQEMLASMYQAISKAKAKPSKKEWKTIDQLTRQIARAQLQHQKAVAGEITKTVPSDFRKHAVNLDKLFRSKAYWNTIRELFARAFESYVQDKT
ncbi:MAG: 2'-5' RNA ligase family protein, partial [Pyrinomonadaceae bacterium]